jgi:predicted O-methyltransferase YrrM
LYDKTAYDAYQNIKTYRNKLNKSKETIEVVDLGEGSKSLPTRHRKIKEMANISSSSNKNAKLLFRLVTYFNFKTILELGTSLGMGTYAMAQASESTKITTIEGCPNTSKFSERLFKASGVTNTTFLKGNFNTIIPTLNQDTFDMIFFDGHHNKEATIQYFELLLPKAHNDSVFVFDDIYWSEEMTEAWEYIKNHSSVTVTVDCFYLGLVFFRKEQVKEHFKIRM